MSELTTRNTETPDVIGWVGGAFSTLIECKVSRADFLSDKHKIFRRCEEMGMGDLRYYAAPKGVLTADDMPYGWGLFEVDSYIRETKEATTKTANKSTECVMLMSALRRLEISTAVYVVQESEETNGMSIMQKQLSNVHQRDRATD